LTLLARFVRSTSAGVIACAKPTLSCVSFEA
jgi:hypothetical protein